MIKIEDILSQIKITKVEGDTYGPWDWGKNSLAVIASSGCEGAVLWWVGGHLDFEISESGQTSLGDLGLDDAPAGIYVWDGKYDYHRDQSYFHDDGGWTEANGDFRVPTKEEWEYIIENRCPWDANDWMKEEHMMASIGRIVHYCPTPEQALQWTKDGNPVTKDSVLAAMVVQTWEEDKVNLRVFLDGTATPWVTSVEKSEEAGKYGFWSWPPRV